MPTSSRTSRGSPCASLAARAWHTRLPRGPRGRALRCSRSDFNSFPGVVLSDGTRYVCEIQLNHIDMLAAKKEAHVYYETVRKELPALLPGHCGCREA